jgi:hypothetical protein
MMVSACSSVKPMPLSIFRVSAIYNLLFFGGGSSPLDYKQKERSTVSKLETVNHSRFFPSNAYDGEFYFFDGVIVSVLPRPATPCFQGR